MQRLGASLSRRLPISWMRSLQPGTTHDQQPTFSRTEDRSHRRRLGLLGRQHASPRRSWCARPARLPGLRLPRRDDDVDPRRGARQEARARLRDRLRRRRDAPVLREIASARASRSSATPAASIRTAAPRRSQALIAEPRAWRCASRSSRATTSARRCATLRAAGTRDMFSGEALPETRAERQRLPRRAADRARARRRRRHRRHRPLRRQRGHARPADARVRLARERLRPARRRQPRRPHHRMRLPGDRRPASPTGRACPTGRTSATRSSSAAPTAASSSPSRAGTGGR